MQLTLKTDYALRILMALAATDEVLSVEWLAAHYGISRNHLAKVAQALTAAQLVVTTRGRTGGMRLALAPGEINVGAVVRRFERFEGFVACMGGEEQCPIEGVCGLKPALGGALEAFLSHLDRFTLADISRRPDAILDRLLHGISQSEPDGNDR
jgi:Rrf2 family transcriptional regulator, nitric oxide-sensitive transcriptional repressor